MIPEVLAQRCQVRHPDALKTHPHFRSAGVLQLQKTFTRTGGGERSQFDKSGLLFCSGSASGDCFVTETFLEHVIVDSQHGGSSGNPIGIGHDHRRGPQGIGDTCVSLPSPTPKLEPPSNALQPRRKVACLSGIHRPSSTGLCVDSLRYHTAQNNSYTLAGRTPSNSVKPVRTGMGWEIITSAPGACFAIQAL